MGITNFDSAKARSATIIAAAALLRPGALPAGVLSREGVVETVAQHAVMDLGRTHSVAPSAAVYQIRRTIHVLHTTGDSDIDLACDNLLGGSDDCLGARATNPVDRHRRDGHWNTSLDGGLPRRIHLAAGLDDITHDDAADRPGIEPGALQGFPHNHPAKLGGRDRLKRSVKRSYRSSDRAAEHDFACCHEDLSMMGSLV